nr:adenylate/guanylate cyclase domain-containing protein [uncultured Butyrivibrio sp.]
MGKRAKLALKIVSAFCLSAIFTIICAKGLLYVPDGYVSDALYQSTGAADGQIVVIGIDETALDELGPLPWDRSIIADVIMYLNSIEKKPAVIGVDVIYSGSGASEASDEYLARAAEAGNVVVACTATYNSTLVVDGSSFYMDDRAVTAFDEPYEALLENAQCGHINVMPDKDGVIRHALISVNDLEGNRISSFSRMVYEKYCLEKNIEVNPEPASENGFWYIPYTAENGNYYDYISVADLYYGRVSPEFFSGKMVLIGTYTVGLQDSYYTSADRSEPMYGIEIQANIIDAYRKGFYPFEAGDVLQLIILFVICFLAAIFFYDRRVIYCVLAEVAVCGSFFIIAYALYQSMGVVLHVLWIPLFVTILFVMSVAVNYIHSYRERKQIINTFGHYVDRSVLKELLDKGSAALELGGKRKRIAVLFVDVRGFTTMSESMEPEMVVEIVNKYLALTTECIMNNHGTLDKFVGDCTMAFWNAPLPQEDPVYMAACAAMDMVLGAEALGEELTKKYGRAVSFGVGINYGDAVVGNIGARERMDYTALGDTVNTAARLEANAPGGQILISKEVVDALGDRAKVTSLGNSIKLKGKRDDFEIFRLDELVRK